MGWDNYHLFEFNVNGHIIGELRNGYEEMGFGPNELFDASKVTLDSIISDTKEKFEYEYDFGDGWLHEILVEKFLPNDKNMNYPNCINGKLNCPPEDCGGVNGFYELLDIINTKKNQKRKELLEWLGGEYNPNHFNLELVNKELLSLDKYIEDWRGNE